MVTRLAQIAVFGIDAKVALPYFQIINPEIAGRVDLTESARCGRSAPASLEQGDLASRFCARGSGSTPYEVSICSIQSCADGLGSARLFQRNGQFADKWIAGLFSFRLEGYGFGVFGTDNCSHGLFDR